MRKIVKISVENYTLQCEFENGEVYEYNMEFISNSDQEMLAPLKEHSFFSKVYIEFGSLAWPNGYDIHADTIIREGKKVKEAA